MTIQKTGNNSIDSLLSGDSWRTSAAGSSGTAITSITYSFMTSSADSQTGFQAMTPAQQQAVVAELQVWANVANIKFTQVTSGGGIQFGTADLGTGASGVTDWSYNPANGVFNHAYVYLNNDQNYQNKNTSAFNLVFTPGTYGPSVLIHEIGHALGFKHPGNYSGSEPAPFLPAATDNRDYSVMSYNDGNAATDYFSAFGGKAYNVTPMLYDIQAMQYIYGANYSYNSSDTVYSFTSTSALQCIWDGGGTDTLDFSGCTVTATIINLNAGTLSSTYVGKAGGAENVGIAYGATIENAIAGSAGSTIYLNSAADTITGGAGNDTIYLSTGTASIDGKGGTNVVIAAAGTATDISHDAFANIQTFNMNGDQVTLTHAEYVAFASLGTGGQVVFADAGTATANASVNSYTLASGANDLIFSAPITGSVATVIGAQSGSDIIDIRNAHLNGTLNITSHGAQDTVDFSGKYADYTLSSSNGVMTVQDTVAGRDGKIVISGSNVSLQFTDTATSSTDPALSFISSQNATRASVGEAQFQLGLSNPSANNVITGEQTANLGAGYDAVILTGPRSQYGVAVDGSGVITLTDHANNQTYTLTSDEYLIFGNAAINPATGVYDMDFNLQGNDAQVAELYNAALGRLPDLAGLEYYAVPINNGTLALHQAAANFLASPEFQSRFTAAAQPADNGGVNDQAYITQLYQNVLHRTPNATEMNYYVQDIQGTLPGIAAQDRAQLLINFSVSPEKVSISDWLI